MPIREIIRKPMQENFILGEADEVKDEDSLLERGGLDSTGVLESVAFIDPRFGLPGEDEELIPQNLDSIGNRAEFILRKATAGRGKEVRQSVAL